MSTIQNKVAGFFYFIVRDGVTGEEKRRTSLEKNLITNQGLDRLGIGNWITACQVGSGSTPPVASDTGLESWVAGSSTIAESSDGVQLSELPHYGWRRLSFTFAAGVAAGNLSEVAMAWANSGATAFSRSLIRDNGIPITLSVQPTDILEVVYEIRSYIPQADVTFQAVISGVTHNCVARPAFVGSSWNISNTAYAFGQSIAGYSSCGETSVLGTQSGGPAGISSNCSHQAATYVAGSRRRDVALTMPLAQGNFPGGIGSLLYYGALGYWQCSFNPPIAKDASRTLQINVQLTWYRA